MLAAYITLMLAFTSVHTTPTVVIKTGVSKASEHANQQDGGVYDASAKKGISNFEGEEGFNLENNKKFVNSEDGGKYAEEHGEKKHHVDESDYAGQKFHDQGGGTVVDVGNKIGHKKGHHRSGFHNSYHKDESGSNSSFYDDGDDHGDEFIYKTHKGTYGDVGKQTNHGAHVEGQDYANEGGRHGLYNQGGAYDTDLGHKKNYHQNQYYDDRALEGRSNAGNRYAEAARDNFEKFHVARPHHVPLPLPPPRPIPPVDGGYYSRAPVKKITIYEDPRVDGRQADYQPEYSGDYIQLDVKRAPAYYDYRSNEDYYY